LFPKVFNTLSVTRKMLVLWWDLGLNDLKQRCALLGEVSRRLQVLKRIVLINLMETGKGFFYHLDTATQFNNVSKQIERVVCPLLSRFE
jgi:hypothetical protein